MEIQQEPQKPLLTGYVTSLKKRSNK